MDENGFKDGLINYRLLWAYGDANKAVIDGYNASIIKPKE